MKITVEEGHSAGEVEVVIRCSRMDDRVVRLVELLSLSDARLTGTKEGEIVIANRQYVPIIKAKLGM